MRARTSAVLVAVLACTGCSVGPGVVRLTNGHELDGRWISSEAYAAFLEGSLFESQGNDREAARAYERALAEDPKSADVWARLGAVRCVTDIAGTKLALDRAVWLDPTLESPWLVRAECELRRRNPRAAVDPAVRAATLSPDDSRASLVVAAAFAGSGDKERAMQWLRALSLRSPGVIDAHRALRDYALRIGDAGTAALAEHDEKALARANGGPTEPLDANTAIGRALLLRDDKLARDLQVHFRWSSSDLAAAAVTEGRIELAKEIAERVLAADSGNVDARVVALVAADLRQDETAFKTTLERLPKERTALGVASAELFRTLLMRRSGSEAGAAWSHAPATPDPSSGRR